MSTTPFGAPGFSGRFNHIEGVAEGVCWLRLSGDEYSRGSLHALSQSDQSAVFLPWEGKEHVRQGRALTWIDGYWKTTDIEMVVDLSWRWERLHFEPQDGWRIDADAANATVVRAPDNAVVVPQGVTVIPGAWDHEHCRFCWEKIGVGGAAEGFRDSQSTWLCENCFKAYVAQHDVSFMAIFGNRWPAENSK